MRLPLSEDVLYRLFIIVFLLFYSTYFILRSELQLPLHYSTPTPSSSDSSGSSFDSSSDSSSDASDSSSGSGFSSLGSSYDEKFTIRVNTFRRNDLLEAFLFHYTTCSKVEVIQVVWSDQVNQPPANLVSLYPSKVVYEKHTTDRLSNRFKAILPPPTRGVLSIDDDLLISCDQLHQGFNIWTSNEQALVGYSPRMHGTNAITGEDRYLRWQNTWWAGVYSIALTKAAFLHKRYLQDFFTTLPSEFIADIDKNRNCEDLAMAYVVAVVSQTPPVWVKAVVHETADFGISTGASHFDDRSICLTKLRQLTLNASSLSYMSPKDSLPLIPSYQKAIPLSTTWDWIRLSQGGDK